MIPLSRQNTACVSLRRGNDLILIRLFSPLQLKVGSYWKFEPLIWRAQSANLRSQHDATCVKVR